MINNALLVSMNAFVLKNFGIETNCLKKQPLLSLNLHSRATKDCKSVYKMRQNLTSAGTLQICITFFLIRSIRLTTTLAYNIESFETKLLTPEINLQVVNFLFSRALSRSHSKAI